MDSTETNHAATDTRQRTGNDRGAAQGVATKHTPHEDDHSLSTRLLATNLSHLTTYYRQTLKQANQSFVYASVAGGLSFLVIIAGIGLLFHDSVHVAAGAITAGAGTLSEFITAVFFYLYRRTAAEMEQYHQRLVVTQNIGIALKLLDNLDGTNRTSATRRLIDTITKDVNFYLTLAGPAVIQQDDDPKTSSEHTTSRPDTV